MLSEKSKLDFLRHAGWQGAQETRIAGDWSQRCFSRLSQKDSSAILMQSYPDDDPRTLPGHKTGDYIRIGDYLSRLRIPVPKIHAARADEGLLLVEDFGDTALHDLFVRDDPQLKDFYLKATDILLNLHERTSNNDLELGNYYDSHVHTGKRRVIDWYLPAMSARRNDSSAVIMFENIWKEIEAALPQPLMRFQHCDFHPHNLMIRPGGEIGLIDFQGALWAAAAYDLVNLLEDARRIVPDLIKEACLAHMRNGLGPEKWQEFFASYQILACQFHCRVIGQAVKLAVRDNKTRLLDYVPVLQAHLVRDLQSPILKPLKDYFDDLKIDFENSGELSFDPDLFAADAF